MAIEYDQHEYMIQPMFKSGGCAKKEEWNTDTGLYFPEHFSYVRGEKNT